MAFFAAEVHAAHGVRKAASQPTAPPAASHVPLTFSDSVEEGVQDTPKDLTDTDGTQHSFLKLVKAIF